jgi:hypothetical protein
MDLVFEVVLVRLQLNPEVVHIRQSLSVEWDDIVGGTWEEPEQNSIALDI